MCTPSQKGMCPLLKLKIPRWRVRIETFMNVPSAPCLAPRAHSASICCLSKGLPLEAFPVGLGSPPPKKKITVKITVG